MLARDSLLWKVLAIFPFPALFSLVPAAPLDELHFRLRSRKHILLTLTQFPSFLQQTKCRDSASPLFGQTFLGRTLEAHCMKGNTLYSSAPLLCSCLISQACGVLREPTWNQNSGLVSPALQDTVGRLARGEWSHKLRPTYAASTCVLRTLPMPHMALHLVQLGLKEGPLQT